MPNWDIIVKPSKMENQKRVPTKREGRKKAHLGHSPGASNTGISLGGEHPPLVFISHDSRDTKIAQTFSTFIQDISVGVLKSFLSSDKRPNQGLAYGTEWYPEILGKIRSSSDIVCILTSRSVGRPWILYEAGIAKGISELPVIGLALGIPLEKVVTGPFALFQNLGDDQESLLKLAMQLAKRIPNSEPNEESLLSHVKAFKSKIEALVDETTEDQEGEETPTSVVKYFEEIKSMYDALPERVAHAYERRGRRNTKRPEVLEFAIHNAGEIEDIAIRLRVLFAIFEDFVPWVGRVGRSLFEGYPAMTLTEVEHSRDLFHRFIMMEEDFERSSRDHHFVGYLMHQIDRTLDLLVEERSKAKARIVSKGKA